MNSTTLATPATAPAPVSVSDEPAFAARWSALERAHGPGLIPGRALAFDHGRGAELFSAGGRRYLDAAAAFGVASLGHGDAELVRAIAEQARRQLACTPSFTNEERALYLEELTAALPGDMRRAFLCNSGTEAIEAALKFARLARPTRPGVVAFMRGFHGRTLGALSATWEKHYRAPFAPLAPAVTHVPFDRIERLEQALRNAVSGDAPIGAVLLEIVQGEGGVRPASIAFLRAAERLCREHDALLIVDEVQTGFGRTGRLFACEEAGIEPDLICLGKGIAGGLPMGAVGIGARVTGLAPGLHGSTFGGNPLACAAARVVLRRLRGGLTDHVQAVGAQLAGGLGQIQNPLIREVRGRGLMLGIELKVPAKPVLEALLERGVIALLAGPRVLRLLPPLVLTRAQADELVTAIAAALEESSEATR